MMASIIKMLNMILGRMARYIANDAGAALITVMLIISVMSVGAVIAYDTLNFSIKRAAHEKQYAQARLYARGGEEMARSYAEKLHEQSQSVKKYLGLDGTQVISFPIDGGSISGALTDISNCFNVNSLIHIPGEQDDSAGENGSYFNQYKDLLVATGFSDGQASHLAATLKDWIDPDTRPSTAGAEDYDYSASDQPYRAANTLIVDITELRLVKGYNAEVLEVILPYLCVKPDTDPSVLHVNSLLPMHAPLLISMIGNNIVSNVDAIKLISERPSSGFGTVADFWKESVFEGKVIAQETRNRIAVKPQAYRSDILVKYHDVEVEMVSNLQMQQNGKSYLISRQFGVMQ